MKKTILTILLFISLISLYAQGTAKWTDPERLKKEPKYFTQKEVTLPPGRFSLNRMFEYDPAIKNMRSVSFDTLGSRFAYQNFKNCINLVVQKGSPQEKQLEESKRKPVQLTCTLQKRTRMRGGVEPFTFYLGIIKAVKVFDPKKMPVQTWGDLRAFWEKSIGKKANVWLKIIGPAPKNLQAFSKYIILDAKSDPGMDAGDPKYPGRSLNPAIPNNKKLYASIMHQAKAAEGFCIATIKIISLPYKHKQYGDQKAGLGVITKLTPLKTAADFGAPKILNTALKKVDGTTLTDPVALTKTPRFFLNKTHLIPGDISTGEPFTKDKDLIGYHTVSFSSLASNFRNNATGGDVVLVYKENSAIERTLKSFDHQHPVIVKFELKPRQRKLGGVLNLEYYLGEITDIKEWPRETWFMVRNKRQELLGKEVWVYLQAMEQANKKNQPFKDFILLNAKSTSQHSAGNPKNLTHALTPALAKDGNENKFLEQIANLNGFCRAKVKILEKDFIPSYDNKNPSKTHLGVIKKIQPLKTAADFGHDSGNSLLKDDVLRTWTPFRKMTPRNKDIEDWFKQTEKKIKRRQYDDLSKKKDPAIAYKSKYRYKKDDQWIYTNELPEFADRERPYQIWERGIRKVTRSNVSTIYGGNIVTYIDYGPSIVKIPTWYRQLYNEKDKTWAKPSTKATINFIKELEAATLKILPNRNKQVKIILDVEENKKLANIQHSVGSWTDTLHIWERSGNYNSPAGKKRIADERKKIAVKKAEVKKLKQEYDEACKKAEPINKKYQSLLDEAADFAEGRKELLGY